MTNKSTSGKKSAAKGASRSPAKRAPRTTAPAAGPTSEDTRRQVAVLEQQLEQKVGELTQTNRQLRRKIFDLYTIFEISRNFNAMLDYETLLDTFIFTCLGQVGALKGVIFLRREARSEKYHPIKSKGSGSLPTEDQFFDVESPLMQYLTRLNRPVPTRDLLGDISSPDEQAILSSFEPGIVVPLIYQTRLTGVFAMSEKISGQEFQLDDLEFLSILGNQIAVAIENARLYESEREAVVQLRTAQQQLLQSERLAALGDMSAKVAHEVNNPLGIIKNYVTLIQRSCLENATATEYTSIVGEEIDRIARIIAQLLDFHRPTGMDLRTINIISVLNNVLRLMDHQFATHSISVVRDYDGPEIFVNAAPEALKQVFLNLVINARDAMKDGGELTVSVHRHGKLINLQFCDTGPGIPSEVIPRIFEPFFTTKDDSGGTGLGLSVCYGIIKKHGGSITFTNRSQGGCFTIELPQGEIERHDAG